jgi:hypothetical protein
VMRSIAAIASLVLAGVALVVKHFTPSGLMTSCQLDR